MELPHYGQILTTKKCIWEFILGIDMPVTENTVRLLAHGLNTQDDYLRLYSTCSRLYYLSRLVYKGKDGIRKPSADWYRKQIYWGRAETADEIRHVMAVQNGCIEEDIPEADSQRVFHDLQVLSAVWCGSIACLWEQIYIPELAYFAEYVLNHSGLVPMPQFDEFSPFPNNYADCDYTQGIADYFEKIMETIF